MLTILKYFLYIKKNYSTDDTTRVSDEVSLKVTRYN